MQATNDTNNLLLIRFIIIKEKSDCFICKDYNNKKYKLMKSEETKKLRVGDDKTKYVKKVGNSFFKDVIILLTKKEEYELTNKHSKTLKDLGVTLDDVYEKSNMG
jgi:hypothetical protein